MYPQYGFHCEIAQDRQSQLFRDAGVVGPVASRLAEIAASQRAEMAASRRRAPRLNAATAFVLSWPARRRSARVRPGLSAV